MLLCSVEEDGGDLALSQMRSFLIHNFPICPITGYLQEKMTVLSMDLPFPC